MAGKKSDRWWQGGVLVLLLGLAALPAWSAAPPLPSGKLTAAQQKRLEQLDQQLDRAALAGKMSEAARLAQQIETLRRRWQGPSHWQTVDARYAIERWQRLARLSEANQKEVARALRRREEASQLQARHRHADAEKIHREVLTIHLKRLGEQHPESATSYDELAINLHAQGKYGEAQLLYEKALDLRKKLLGEEHPDTATSYNNVAMNLNAQGKYPARPSRYTRSPRPVQEAAGRAASPTPPSATAAWLATCTRRASTVRPGNDCRRPWTCTRNSWARSTPTPPDTTTIWQQSWTLRASPVRLDHSTRRPSTCARSSWARSTPTPPVGFRCPGPRLCSGRRTRTGIQLACRSRRHEVRDEEQRARVQRAG